MEKEIDKVSFGKALAKVIDVVEEEGYCEGWDFGESLGRSSGERWACYKFVEYLVDAYDKCISEMASEKEVANLTTYFDIYLEVLKEMLPFEIDWDNKTIKRFKDDTEEKESD